MIGSGIVRMIARVVSRVGGRGTRRRRTGDALSVRTVLTPFLAGQRRRLTFLAVSAVVGGFAEATVLVLIARIGFALASHNSTVRIDAGPETVSVATPALIGLAAGLVIVRMALNVWQAHLGVRTSTSVLNTIRKSLVRMFLGSQWSLQSAEREGRLQELLTTYAYSASSAVTSLVQCAVAALNLVALIAVALVVNPEAALAVVAAAALIGLTLRPIRSAVQRRSRRAGEANLAFATALTELAATTQEARIFGVEDKVRTRLERLSDGSSERLYRTRLLGGLAPAIYQGSALLLVVGALGLAYAAGATGLASLGAVVLIMLRSLTYGQAVQTGMQSLHESVPYCQTLSDEQQRYVAGAVSRAGASIDTVGNLAFENVDFEYTPGHPVLRDVSFATRRGEIVGIVGPSGAGKSTLVQLILRLRDPSAGRILVDGRDAYELALDDWYRHVTFVPQDAHLFAGTVAENIRFFRDHVDAAMVERAVKRAHLDEEIAAMPEGLDTPGRGTGRRALRGSASTAVHRAGPRRRA